MTAGEQIVVDVTSSPTTVDGDKTLCPVEGCGERFYSKDLLTDHLDDDHQLRERVLRAQEVVIRGE